MVDDPLTWREGSQAGSVIVIAPSSITTLWIDSIVRTYYYFNFQLLTHQLSFSSFIVTTMIYMSYDHDATHVHTLYI